MNRALHTTRITYDQAVEERANMIEQYYKPMLEQAGIEEAAEVETYYLQLCIDSFRLSKAATPVPLSEPLLEKDNAPLLLSDPVYSVYVPAKPR